MKTPLFLVVLALSFALTPHAWAENFYPENYEASRARFRAYCTQIQKTHPGAETIAIQVPALTKKSESLTVDTLYLPALKRKRALVVLTSGNHGPEGYAGSALQAVFIEKVLPTLDMNETGILLIHALNPWGFKHHRRGTEAGVNLNRNFEIKRDLFQTLNTEYDKVKPLIELEGPVRSAYATPAKDLLLEMLLKKEVTQQTLTEAIGKGQYSTPQGINFGGRDFEPQTLAIVALFKKIAPPYAAFFHIDFHTGLGKESILHVMTQKEMTAPSRALHDLLFDSVKDPDDLAHFELTPPNTKGFYPIFGDYADILSKIMPEENRVIIAVTAEVGTIGNGLVGKTRTINRLILENQGANHGYSSPEIKASVERDFLELFYPSSESWRRRTLRDGEYFLSKLIPRFQKLALD